MNEELAQEIIRGAVALDTGLGALFSSLRRVQDERLRKKLEKATGDIMGFIARDLIFPIVNIYPQLNPDK